MLGCGTLQIALSYDALLQVLLLANQISNVLSCIREQVSFNCLLLFLDALSALTMRWSDTPIADFGGCETPLGTDTLLCGGDGLRTNCLVELIDHNLLLL